MMARITTTAEFRAAIDRMRHRIGTARTRPTARERMPARRLPVRSTAPSWRTMTKAGSLRLSDTFDQFSRGRIAHRLCINSRRCRLERRSVEIRRDLDADRFRLGLRAHLKLLPSLVHEAARFERGLAKDFSFIVRKTVPGLERHHQYFGSHRVLGEGVIFGVFVMAAVHEGGPVV